MELVRQGLVIYTWGNVSGIDREKGLVVIKPSGVDYDVMKVEEHLLISSSIAHSPTSRASYTHTQPMPPPLHRLVATFPTSALLTPTISTRTFLAPMT